MTPEDLWILLDTERRTSILLPLPNEFIFSLKECLANITNGEEERAIRRKVVNLIQRRQGKIVQLAINNTPMLSLLSVERRLYVEIKEACKTFEEDMLKELNGEA